MGIFAKVITLDNKLVLGGSDNNLLSEKDFPVEFFSNKSVEIKLKLS